MQVTNWMTPNPVCVGPRESLAKAGALMAAGGFRQLPVVDNGHLIGIVTDRDLRHHTGYLESTLVDAAMTSCPVVISPSDSVEVAAELMQTPAETLDIVPVCARRVARPPFAPVRVGG